MILEFSRQVFIIQPRTKFHEYSSSGTRAVPCGQTDEQADLKQLIVAFLNFANESKMKISKLFYFPTGP